TDDDDVVAIGVLEGHQYLGLSSSCSAACFLLQSSPCGRSGTNLYTSRVARTSSSLGYSSSGERPVSHEMPLTLTDPQRSRFGSLYSAFFVSSSSNEHAPGLPHENVNVS